MAICHASPDCTWIAFFLQIYNLTHGGERKKEKALKNGILFDCTKETQSILLQLLVSAINFLCMLLPNFVSQQPANDMFSARSLGKMGLSPVGCCCRRQKNL